MRIPAFVPPLILLSFLLSSGLAAANGTQPETARSVTKNAAPSFTLPTRSGTVAPDSLRGHVVLVDFWASWCVPCAQSFPWLANVQKHFGDKGLKVVAINLDKKRDAADTFLRKHAAPFAVAFDPAGKTAEAFHVKAMPSSYLISPEGTILFAHRGFDSKHTQEMEAQIQKACEP